MASPTNGTLTVSDVNNKQPIYLLADGELQLKGYDYWRWNPLGDSFGIESVTNYSTTQTITIEAISDTTVEFAKNYDNDIIEDYQIRDGVRYNPTHYGKRFYDENFDLIGTDNSTSDYQLERQINRITSERTRVINPFGSSYIGLTAYYDSPEVYSRNTIFTSFGGLGSYSNVYNINASTWTIGEEISSNLIITGELEFHGLQVWKVEHKEVLAGFSTFEIEILYEKTSGLVVKQFSYVVKVDEYSAKYLNELTSGFEVIDDGYPNVSAPIGTIVNTGETVNIIFILIENHYDHYNLYRNGSLFETGTAFKPEWLFNIPVTRGNTTWTLEIYDSLGYKGNATTWVLLIESVTTSITSDSSSTTSIINENPSSPASYPLTTFITIFATTIYISVRRKMSIHMGRG